MKEILVPVLLGGGFLGVGAWIWHKCLVTSKVVATHTGGFDVSQQGPGGTDFRDTIFEGSSDTILLTVERTNETDTTFKILKNGISAQTLEFRQEERSRTMKLANVDTIEIELGSVGPSTGTSVSGTYTISVSL